MTDNRTNEPAEAQVEAAWQSLLETAIDVTNRGDVRAALVAAAAATPQAGRPASEGAAIVAAMTDLGWDTHDGSPWIVDSHEVQTILAHLGAVRQVSESDLAEVIGKARTVGVRGEDGVKSIVMASNEVIARAVLAWVGGESRGE